MLRFFGIWGGNFMRDVCEHRGKKKGDYDYVLMLSSIWHKTIPTSTGLLIYIHHHHYHHHHHHHHHHTWQSCCGYTFHLYNYGHPSSATSEIQSLRIPHCFMQATQRLNAFLTRIQIRCQRGVYKNQSNIHIYMHTTMHKPHSTVHIVRCSLQASTM